MFLFPNTIYNVLKHLLCFTLIYNKRRRKTHMIKTLPSRLKELRISHGYSQKEVAQKLGISPSIISGYETGERTPSTENLLTLSYLYKCSTDFLLGKTNDSPALLLDVKDLTPAQIQVLQSLIHVMRNK